MRLFADEKRQRTDQLLMTVPVSVAGIVLGKYFAAVGVFLFTLLITILYPVTMSFFGRLPVWEILGGYVGFFLLGCTFIAVGMLMSSLTDNQVIAAVSTFAALLLMWIIDFVQNGVPAGTVPGVVFASALGVLLALWVYLATRNLVITGATVVIVAAVIVAVALTVAGFFETFIIDFLAWVLPHQPVPALHGRCPGAEPDRLLPFLLDRAGVSDRARARAHPVELT